MADSRAGAGNISDKPGASCSASKWESSQKANTGESDSGTNCKSCNGQISQSRHQNK